MRPTRLLVAVALLALGACYTDPNAQLDQMQQNLDLENTLADLTARTSELQFTMDSLVTIVARQDSTIATLANLAGVRYVR